jgi:light-regulated signal transduction histidine kinase (bacteriophytochrome)
MRQPLRAITGHWRLLDQSIKATFGHDERENLHFALDGAHRMDSMIVALLAYSRLGRQDAPRKSPQPNWHWIRHSIFCIR